MKLPRSYLSGRRQARRRASPRIAWEGAGLLVLGIVAAAMAAFPSVTSSVLHPVRGVFSFAWRTGLGGVESVRDLARGGVRALSTARGLARRNAELEKRLESAGKESVLREEEKRELVRLRRLLDFRDALGERAVTARIIGSDPSAPFSTLVIDRGATDGLREGAPVAAPAGVVGRILSVGEDHATVAWLADPRSRLSAYVQRTRVMGVLAGNGDLCELKYIPPGEDVQVGDRVLTAGRGSVFPKGILVGTVKEVRKDGLSLSAVVAPAVNLKRLEEVLVIPHSSTAR